MTESRDGSLSDSAKSKISIYCRYTYPVVKVRTARRSTAVPERFGPEASESLVGGRYRRRGTGHGSRTRSSASASMRRSVIETLRFSGQQIPSSSIFQGQRGQVVETRRLELLTLSLQRRCSTS